MALINLRNALMTGKRLPYDAEVEFLESTGTQYINTNIKPGPNTRAEIVFAMTTFTANCGLFGARDISSANLFYNLFIINNSGHRVQWDWCGKGDYKTSEAETSTAATYILGAAGSDITRDGVSLMSVSSTKTALNQPLYIFNFNNNGSPYSTGANARFWSVKIYEGQTLVFDAIPVRKGTVGYLYDRVSGKLFGNAGTGDFVLGPDVVPVEYIESHETEYIDTGVKVADPSTISISVDSDGVTPFGVIHNIVAAGTWLGINYRTSATEVAVYSKDFNSRGLFEFSAGRHTFKWDGATGFLIDGVSKSSFVATVGTDAIDSISWPLFGRYDFANGSIGGIGSSRFYGGNIETSGSSARKFRPVRVGTDATSWEGAMMDTLTRRIYRNQGTGAFGYGNDLKYPIPSE